jgi:hypothetical protein
MIARRDLLAAGAARGELVTINGRPWTGENRRSVQ